MYWKKQLWEIIYIKIFYEKSIIEDDSKKKSLWLDQTAQVTNFFLHHNSLFNLNLFKSITFVLFTD